MTVSLSDFMYEDHSVSVPQICMHCILLIHCKYEFSSSSFPLEHTEMFNICENKGNIIWKQLFYCTTEFQHQSNHLNKQAQIV